MVFSSSGEERRLEMSTKMGFWRWALASAAMVVLVSSTANARLLEDDRPSVTTNNPAGVVYYPKLRVNVLDPGGTDTIIQLTNTSDFLTRVHCFYVNANGHCSNDSDTICTDATFRDDCPAGGRCIPGWQETDFRLTLTKRQPISWSVNQGLSELPLNSTPGQGDPPQFNEGNIPPAPENPFMGELICIQVDVATELPTDRNDLKGEATIITTGGGDVDARKYTAIGIPAIEGAQDGDPNTLNIGGPDAEYNACPNILTLNHFFDNASVTSHGGTVVGPVRSEITVVPCANDFLHQDLNITTAVLQFLIYNEFEQRFSTSTRVTCFRETLLSDIDTRPGEDGNEFSIFSAGVQGTLTGHSTIRPVVGPDVDGYDANSVVAILEENWGSGTCSTSTGTDGANGYVHVSHLCASAADCPALLDSCSGCQKLPLEPVCLDSAKMVATTPQVKTTAENVQYRRLGEEVGQGDRLIIPLP
jgi:hypothetical protein